MCLEIFQDLYPFGFCAARFLRQWEQYEQAHFNAISKDPSDDDIINAIRYFRVSRNFPGLTEDRRVAGTIRALLFDTRNDTALVSPVDKVNHLTTLFGENFDSFNLSAASKLLWLSIRSPIMVYDGRVASALSIRGGYANVIRDYENYTRAWRAEYEAVEVAIEKAIKNLPNGRAFMPYTQLTDAELVAFAEKQWFKERVFDIFLWELGGED